MDKKELAIELSRSKMLDFNLFIAEVSFEEIFKKYELWLNKKRFHKIKHKKAMNIVLANLKKNQDLDMYTMLGLSNLFYIKDISYNPQKIRWDIIKQIINFLIEKKYIIIYKGFKRGKIQRISKIKANENLIQQIKTKKVKSKNRSLILIKNSNKELIKPIKTKLFIRREKFVQEINKVLEDNYITFKKKLYPQQKLYRVFNDSSLKKGGRFYGGDFQILKKRERKFLYINGNRTCELDYSCLHINLLYDKINYTYREDAYSINSYDNNKFRKLIKFILITMLNSSSYDAAVSAIKYNINKGKLPKANVELIIQELLQKHSKISQYFFNKKVGLELQYKESMLAEEVMRQFIFKGKRVKVLLPIHDGFLCEKQYESQLFNVMKNSYKKIIKGKNCHITKLS